MHTHYEFFFIAGVHIGLNDNLDRDGDIEMEILSVHSQCQRIARFNEALITIFQKEMTYMSRLDPEESSLIIQSYEQHHKLGCAEVFFEHLEKCDNIKMVEKVFDIVKNWECNHAHEKNIGKVYQCFMENIKDLQLRSWIFTQMNRGCFYDLEKKIISPKNKKTLIFYLNLFLGIVGIILFYFDIFKDILFFRILGHLWTNVLVKCFLFLLLTFLRLKYYSFVLVYE